MTNEKEDLWDRGLSNLSRRAGSDGKYKMATKVIMPKLGLIMQKGTVLAWRSKEGDAVERGKPLFSIDTEKVTLDIESPASGVLRKIFAHPGSTVAVGGLLAIISEPNEAVPDLDQLAQEAEKSFVRPVPPRPLPTSIGISPTRREKILISPLARRLAEEHHIDVSQIIGTGPGGRIQKQDVLKAIESAKAVSLLAGRPAVARIVPLSTMRSTIVERLSRSYANALHVTLQVETDFSKIVRFRQNLLQQPNETHPSYTDLIVKAVSSALREHQLLNSTIEGDQIKIFKNVNIGVAVALADGLVVPVVKNADLKKLDEITEEIEDLTERAREGKLALDDVTGGTFTITNLGMYGIDSFSPIINPPEAAILAMGRIINKPVVVQGQVCVQPMATLTLTFDHRIVDGAQAAEFMKKLVTILTSPELLKK